jgi:hypothetical protein
MEFFSGTLNAQELGGAIYIYNFKIHAKIMTDAYSSDFKLSSTSGK